MPFKYLKFSEQEKLILNDCFKANLNVKSRWLFSNLLVPILLIALTIILTVIARVSEAELKERFDLLLVSYNAVKEVLFTGGITLIGINTLTIMAGYVIGAKRESEIEDGIDEKHRPKKNTLYRIREKLHDFSYPLLIIGSFVYVTQIIYKPQNVFIVISFLLVIAIVLRSSLKISLQMYITKDELFLKTYAKSMAENMKETVKSHTSQLEEEDENE